jgi:hypothetical protein
MAARLLDADDTSILYSGYCYLYIGNKMTFLKCGGACFDQAAAPHIVSANFYFGAKASTLGRLAP